MCLNYYLHSILCVKLLEVPAVMGHVSTKLPHRRHSMHACIPNIMQKCEETCWVLCTCTIMYSIIWLVSIASGCTWCGGGMVVNMCNKEVDWEGGMVDIKKGKERGRVREWEQEVEREREREREKERERDVHKRGIHPSSWPLPTHY